MALLLLFSFAACSVSDEPTKEINNAESENSVQTATSETDYGLNETAVFKNLKFTATEIKESSGTDFFEPESGKTFVGVKFTIENISNETQTVSSLMLFSAYANDVKCDYSFSAACAFDEGTLDGDVSAGKKLVGWYAMEVPADWSKIDLEVKSEWLSGSSAKFVFTK